ncbi:helix-turn-helix domain-containing protein [Limoniibacter endophyticus]|uniref:Transcriptional regulator n=1 Tax=Limoniibacter endophyticus TaxID=1565040 RepID=A0A8J3DTB1_9HYPH|nr:helix-turn-helix transcriptional regulator [Limoniibacter endophyticus]GHC74457.1 transcriptional regulator [Limoniibacter endophyticus]
MTPFGERLRELRARHGVTQREMAQAIGVTPAYLSALEHGKRGKPSWTLLQKIMGYFNVIWDDAEALFELAEQSHPRIKIDTGGLSPAAMRLVYKLSENVHRLPAETLAEMEVVLDASIKSARKL